MTPLELLKTVTIARGEAKLVVASLDLKDGSPGKDGTDGTDGERGADGTIGDAGVKGDKGVPGRDGVDGHDGKDGTDGLDGRNGTDGVVGRDGADGKRGPRGYKGAPGDDGDDGDQGVGVRSAKVHQSDGHLYITLTSGVKIDAGKIKPDKDIAVIGGGRGATGKSAYDIAVENGFVGTEEEWLASLGTGFADTFETISKNLRAEDATLAYVSGDLSTVTYADGVVKTLGYTTGTLTTITLSGAPAGVTDIVKTLTYNGGGDLIGFSYGPT